MKHALPLVSSGVFLILSITILSWAIYAYNSTTYARYSGDDRLIRMTIPLLIVIWATATISIGAVTFYLSLKFLRRNRS